MLSFVFTALLSQALVASAEEVNRKSPQYQHSFQLPLLIPTIKEALTTHVNPESGVPIDFYQLDVKDAQHSFYPNLRNTTITGFDGSFMGPTFRVHKGRETVVRLVNKSNKKVNLHLHGSFTRTPFDGWAMDILTEGEYKDYYYPNSINARTLWYHDHAHKVNALNMYQGLFGMYQIVDPASDKDLGLPYGDKYDVPLAFTAHYFTEKGELSDESKERSSIWGDTWLVNGRIQPFLQVEPRKYRFRILNGAVSRGLNISLEQDGRPVSFHVIGSDGGLKQSPTKTKSLVTGMGERWEVSVSMSTLVTLLTYTRIILDFSPFKNQNLLVRTTNMFTDQLYPGMDKTLQFRVGQTVSNEEGNGNLPASFNVNLKFPQDKIAATREFKLVSHMDMMWGINSYHMDDPMKRVMMKPPLGTIEKIVFKSGGMNMGSMGSMMGSAKGGSSSVSGGMGDMGGSTQPSHHGGGMGSIMEGSMSEMPVQATSLTTAAPPTTNMASGTSGHLSHHGRGFSDIKKRQMDMSSMMNGMNNSTDFWSHSMHLHLVDIRIVGRRKEHQDRPEGRDYTEEYEKDALKDIAFLGSNEIVEVLVKYQPFPGLYMWHCHNAVHEDNGMMAVMNITRLSDLGYSDLDAKFDDPMDVRFQPQRYKDTNLSDIKVNLLPSFARLKAYPNPQKLRDLEDQYWAKRPIPDEKQSEAEVPKNTDPDKQAFHNTMHGNGGQMNMGAGNSPSTTVGSSQSNTHGSGSQMNMGTHDQPSMNSGSNQNLHGHHGAGGMSMSGMNGMQDMKMGQ